MYSVVKRLEKLDKRYKAYIFKVRDYSACSVLFSCWPHDKQENVHYTICSIYNFEFIVSLANVSICKKTRTEGHLTSSRSSLHCTAQNITLRALKQEIEQKRIVKIDIHVIKLVSFNIIEKKSPKRCNEERVKINGNSIICSSKWQNIE